MSTDSVFGVLFSWQAGLLMFGLFVFIKLFRHILETGRPELKKNKWWNEVVLPVLPVLLGVLVVYFAKQYPWPTDLTKSASARILLGLTLGGGSGWIFKIFKGVVKKNFGVDLSTPPDGPEIKLESIHPPQASVPVIVDPPEPPGAA